MSRSLAASSEAGRLRPPTGERRHTAALIGAGLAAGALVALLSTLGLRVQLLAVLGLGLALPLLLVFLVRPPLAFAGYLLLLPLMLSPALVGGMNAGETLTLLVMALAPLVLWPAARRVLDALRSLRAIVLPLLGLAVVSVLSIIANNIVSASEIVSAVVKILAFALIPVVVYVVAKRQSDARLLLHAIVLGGGAVACYAIVEYLAGWGYSEVYDWNRSRGTFENWNQLGGFMVLVSMPTLALSLTPGAWARRAAFGALFVLEITALLLSSTLGSLVALVVGAGGAMLFLFRVPVRNLIGIALLFGVAFVAVYMTNELLRERLADIDSRVLDRFMTYAVGWAMMKDQFWFGFGSQSQVIDALAFGDADYGLTIFGQASAIPHNSFLLMAVEKGIFGLLFFTILIAGALVILLRHRRIYQASRYAMLYRGIVAGGLGFLVQNMTNNLILHARIGIVFLSLIAIVAALGDRLQAEETPARAT